MVRQIAGLALAVWLVAGCGVAPGRPVKLETAVPCARADCLRVLSWNVHAIPFLSPQPGKRLRNVARKIREQQPDVVLLQEVWLHAYARQLGRDLRGAYRVVTAVGCGRPFPCGGLAILVRVASGWTVSAPAFIAYEASAPWHRFREWDYLAKKGILMVRLARDGRALAVVDTHLQTEYVRYGRDYSALRRAQLEQLAATLAERFPAEPVLLGGDLNTAPREASGLYESHVVHLGDDRTAAVRAACGECGTRPALPRPARWLDYLITRRLTATAAVVLVENEIADQPFSDHNGLLGRFEYAADALR